MDETAKLLFEYLRDMMYRPAIAILDLDKLDEDFRELGEGLVYFAKCLDEQRGLAKALSKGDLSTPLPSPSNELAAPLKALHASLRHMTWQSQQVAKGCYQQRIDFMGDFADAFNTMIEQLDARQKALENEIELGRKKAQALEQSSSLLASITSNIPQLIVVFGEDSRNILYLNKSASEVMASDEAFKGKLLGISEHIDEGASGRYGKEFSYDDGIGVRYLSVDFYSLQWSGQNAKAFVLSDISESIEHVKELEFYAYQDNLTKLYNRYFGMQVFNRWLDENKHFALCFADLDNLKYVNDSYGHFEGDVYIKKVAYYLQEFSPDCVVCRLGGDEFMVLASGFTFTEAQARMKELHHQLLESNLDKPYYCRVSYGIVEVKPDNTLPANEILSLADERMYAFKRLNKRARKH